MARIGLAFKVFFKVLSDEAAGARVRRAMEGETQPPLAPPAAAPAAPAVREPARPAPLRNDALNLLAVLQREARLVDFLKEDIAAHDDAQIGAAVRDVHRASAAALERLFALRPVRGEAEGSRVTVSQPDAGRTRLTGNVAGTGPYQGTLNHSGWEASKLELPEWSGSDAAARVVAPAEIEVS